MYSSSVILILLTIITRFYGINWGNGFFFNPDENNMVNAILNMSASDLNPHFFAYGQFPLFLAYFSRIIFGLSPSFETTAYILRFFSASFSSLSVLVFYLISKKVANIKVAVLATLLAIFTPGLIQLSHFGTTESLLILVFLTNILLSFYLIHTPLNYKIYLISAVIIGAGMASKLSALIFLFPILLVSLFNFLKPKNRLKIVLLVLFNFLFILIIFISFSPYTIIENADFLSALKYETDVATGRMRVFYTSQFLNTQAYVFQIIRIFPHAISLPIYILSIVGLVTTFIKNKNKNLTIFLHSSLVYFLYFGQLYVKWTRFMSPIFYIFPLLAAICLVRIKSNYIKWFIIIISLAPGLYYMRLYVNPDIRITASKWMTQNIPSGSRILSEGGNVVDIPTGEHEFSITNFDFYDLENNPKALNNLIISLYKADYIIVPSRRVFMNQKGPLYPYSHAYYQALFSDKLGFAQIKSFSLKTDVILNQEFSEETWTVFDHPTIRIFKKINGLSMEEYEKILKT